MSLREEFTPKDSPLGPLLVQTLIATGVMTLIDFTFAVSGAAFIFSGDLARFIPAGISALLVCSIIPNLIVAFRGSNPSTICAARGGLTPVYATLVVGIAASVAAGGKEESLLPTLVAGIAAGTVITGIVLFLLGQFRLGSLIRYIPYPVMGGFFAGLGYLILTGGIGVMAGKSVEFSTLGPLFEGDVLIRWLPGLVFGVALYVAQRFKDHWLIVPAFFGGAALLFFGWLYIQGVSLDMARERGFLLVVESTGAFWPAIGIADLGNIEYGAIAGQFGTLAVIAIIGAISLLLDASGIEMLTRKDVDLNQDLKVAGIGNVLCGAAGGAVGVHTAGDTAFTHNLGAKTRLAAVAYALFCVLALFFGSKVLGLVPVPVLGGLLVYLGSAFLVQWLIDEWKKLPRIDYFLVVIIMLAMASLGVLEGVGVGLVLAIILFCYNYSKVEIIKFAFPGKYFDTYVDRPREHVELLDQEGDRIHVYVLEGYLFFGSANKMLETIRARINDPEQKPVGYLILDFRLVTQIDSSVAFSFGKLKLLAENEDFKLVMTQLSAEIQSKLESLELFSGEGADLVKSFPEISQGGAWCQDQLLKSFEAPPIDEHSLDELLASAIPERSDREIVEDYFEKQEVPADHVLFEQGDPGDSLFLIGSGNVAVTAEVVPGVIKRLRTLSTGSVIGEMALYTSESRSAAATMTKPGVLFRLSDSDWERLSSEHPHLAAGLHAFIVRLLSDRLIRTNTRLMRALS